MTNTSSINDIESFCRLLAASGLVPAGSIDAMLADFRKQPVRELKYGHSLTAFATYVVARGVVTCWQIAKLRNGQSKGFFLDGYKLVDHIGDDRRCGRYLADSTTPGNAVILCVVPPSIAPLKDGKPEYWIEEFTP